MAYDFYMAKTTHKVQTIDQARNLGEVIRRRRESLGLKVFQLADSIPVKPEYITQIEKYNKLPAPPIIIRIAHELKFQVLTTIYFLEKEYSLLSELNAIHAKALGFGSSWIEDDRLLPLKLYLDEVYALANKQLSGKKK